MKKHALFIFLFLIFLFFLPSKIYALSNISDTISTSRSSSSTPTTAMHTILFNNKYAIPALGRITITFPALISGDSNNPASASASTFQLNGLSDAQVKINGLADAQTFKITAVNPTTTGEFPTIQIDLTGTTTIPASTSATIFLGCSVSAGTICTTRDPKIINPTKTKISGTADFWRLQIYTRDTVNNKNLENVRIKINTFESVNVQANIDPTLTVAIAGITDSTAINEGNFGCNNTETTNTGIDSTFNSIALGKLTSSKISVGAQRITISTNESKGYSLTASSDSHLADLTNNSFLDDSPIPELIIPGKTWFGIHPCGLDVNKTTWGSGGTGNGLDAKYAWPSKTNSLTLSTDSSGPIAGDASGNGVVSIEYGATVSPEFPTGEYSASVTYTVTTTF